ncbi:MAG TPA: penicillin-binding protein 2, partial [Candidatus Paceibacterota bacterium]|nr:penicillin-binding protein 2 [Candidatus Paceibacterota bacterium]
MRGALRLKLRIFSGAIIFFALLVIVRLYFVQIVDGEKYALKAEHQYQNTSQSVYDRGSIYFTRKDGTLISAAGLGTGFRLAIDPQHLKDPEAAYAAVNALTPVDYEEFMESAAKKDDPYESITTHVPEAAGRAIDELDIPGVLVERERWRSYPAGENGAQTIGFVAYDNDNTLAGRFGLERYYNDVLDRGKEGLFGNFFAELFANVGQAVADGRSGQSGDVVTSIEPVVEEKLMQVLADIQAQYGSTETSGIIMDPATGEIIALGTYPTFDPNDFANGNADHFGNPLVERRYEFGSIMKALTMVSGLDAGVITPESTYNDTGKLTLNGKTISNFDGKARGVVPMQQVLSQSLNVGAAHIANQMGHDKFRAYIKKLGLGTETGIDLPSEIPGQIDNILDSPRDIEYATASYGQGIAETPVEMIRALGALANRGSIVTPHLATAIRLETGLEKKLSWGTPERVFKPEAVEQTTQMLVSVVDKSLANGSVRIPEMSVAAKTGTAQIAGPGGKYA